jgi:hypothetical protein
MVVKVELVVVVEEEELELLVAEVVMGEMV